MTEEMQNLKNRIAKMFRDKAETFWRMHDKDGLHRFIKNFEHNHEVTSAAGDDHQCILDLWKRLLKSEVQTQRSSL